MFTGKIEQQFLTQSDEVKHLFNTTQNTTTTFSLRPIEQLTVVPEKHQHKRTSLQYERQRFEIKKIRDY